MCNWPTNGNLTGTLSVGQGERGKSLEYEWRGTELGIRVEGEEYQFVNLAGEGSGREIELQVGNGYLQWRYKDEEEWNNLISIDSLKGEPGEQGPKGDIGPKGEKGEQGLPGEKGEKGERGPQGEQGIQGIPGEQGPHGLPGRDGVDGKNGIDGTNGQDGVTPNITIGTVTTLEPNQKATVTKRGTKEEPIFDFGIPKGADGTGGSDAGASIDDSTISKDKTWSSSKIEDFVLTNNNTIWKDVNGENLKIENTKEGYLREVEIWGNTIQNQDDLSDIKHLGELYVDSEGRKQYKIEIESREALSLSYHQAPRNATINETYVKLVCDNNTKKWADVIYALNPNDVKIGDIVTLEITIINKTNLKANIGFNLNNQHNFGNNVPINTTILNKKQVYTTEITKLPNIKSRFLMFAIDFTNLTDTSQEGSIEFYYKIYSNKTKSHKTTILMPCQLMKVGDISDRLYWDKSKGKYVIEKNIKTTNLPAIENITNSKIDGDKGGRCGFDCLNKKFKEWQEAFPGIESLQAFLHGKYELMKIPGVISTTHYINNWLNGPERGKLFSIHHVNPNTENAFITLVFRDTNCTDIEQMNNWVMSFSGKVAYYRVVTPEIIDTNITEELKLPTYINNTYISVNGGIQGSIKAKAPVDGGKVIATLQRENIELKATNEVQDELINTTMLATDEMFMMLEPLLAEVVNLNERSASKMVDMYVAMVKRGLKKIEDVPARYREQVKEILMELE